MPSSLFQNPSISGTRNQIPVTMSNPIQPQMQQVAKNKDSQDRILQMWSTVKNSSNPNQVMEQLIMQNPELKQIIDTINAIGDPKKAFYALAEKLGKDPNEVLSMLK